MSAFPSIYFRTDGNAEIATGHLMRCLSIARACAGQGADVTFIVSDEESLALLQERFDRAEEFGVHCLHSDYRRMMEEIPKLTAYLEQHVSVLQSKKPWLFIDSYSATPAYFAALRPHCQVAYLDDLRSFPCDVDLLIHYDTDEDCPFYAAAKRKLLGAAYTPLREQFAKPPYEVRPVVRSILLSTGGTDPYNVTEHLLTRIFDAENSSGAVPDCHVLTSSANSRYDRLLALAKDNPRIHIHSGVKDMAALMASCDLAVSAGGTTLCELCAVGVPTVSYLMAENQRTAVETFAANELIPYAGDIRDLSTLDNLLIFLTRMSQNAEARKKSSQAMRAFLDGLGAERIAEALLS